MLRNQCRRDRTNANQRRAGKIVSGFLKLDSLLPDVFSPRASCADAAVNLLGVPYDFWSLALFIAIDGVLTLALITTLRRG